jgi:hypothetical protein
MACAFHPTEPVSCTGRCCMNHVVGVLPHWYTRLVGMRAPDRLISTDSCIMACAFHPTEPVSEPTLGCFVAPLNILCKRTSPAGVACCHVLLAACCIIAYAFHSTELVRMLNLDAVTSCRAWKCQRCSYNHIPAVICKA